MEISERTVGDVIQLSVSGNVDTISASELQQRVLLSFQKTKNLVLDIEGVAYMSSAGLRALLLGQKTATSNGGTLKLVHVQPSVMKVFEMSGFNTILTIEQ